MQSFHKIAPLLVVWRNDRMWITQTIIVTIETITAASLFKFKMVIMYFYVHFFNIQHILIEYLF